MLLLALGGAASARSQSPPAAPKTKRNTESSLGAKKAESSNSELESKPITWQGRHAYAIRNDLIQLVALSGGGHIAEFRFHGHSGLSGVSPLWRPVWDGIEPYLYREDLHASRYSSPPTGQLLAGIAGHSLCLDYFGSPSDEETNQGLPIHGEAGILLWRNLRAEANREEAVLQMSATLPVAELAFTREIKVRRGESVVYFNEEVVNNSKADHLFHWTQHVSLGPPFLRRDDSRIFLSATRGRTFPHGYEGKELLASGADFDWPHAPALDGNPVDLRRPLSHPGRGFVATVLMDPGRDQQYVSALNVPDRLLVGYCFNRKNFPWTAIWEENKARAEAPWNGQSETRGLEFGSTPLPVGRREAFAAGPLFGTPCFSIVPALGRTTVRYTAFLAQVPAGIDEISDIRLADREVRISYSGGTVRLPAAGLQDIGTS